MLVAVLFFVVVAFPVAYALRTLVVAATRHRWPGIAAAARRWWAWVPLVGAGIALTWLNLVVGLIACAAIAVMLTRAEAMGSPFRPRR